MLIDHQLTEEQDNALWLDLYREFQSSDHRTELFQTYICNRFGIEVELIKSRVIGNEDDVNWLLLHL